MTISASVLSILLLSSFLAFPAHALKPTSPPSLQNAGVWFTLSQFGLDWLNDLILQQLLPGSTPLPLPDVTAESTIPFLGRFTTSFSNFTLHSAHVGFSTISVDDTSILVVATDVSVNLTLNWWYNYRSFWLPGPVSGSGEATIQVNGMQGGISLNAHECNGTLQLNILQSGVYINDLDVQLYGDNSWIYQWLVDVLKERIRITTEEQLNEQVRQGVSNVNSIFLSLRQQVPVDDTSGLNLTVVSEPVFNSTFISVGLRGEFVTLRSINQPPKQIIQLQPGMVCNAETKMASIAFSESVLNDGAAVYYNMDLLNGLIDSVSGKTFLNTSLWKYLIPQLYHDYPNEEIKLRFEVSSLPTVLLTSNGIEVSAPADMIIEVIHNSNITPVACISITSSLFGITGLNENKIVGQIRLKDLNLDVKWSEIGKIHLALAKVFLKDIVKGLILPYMNLNLSKGLPLPSLPFMELTNSEIQYGAGFLLVCTDVQYETRSIV